MRLRRLKNIGNTCYVNSSLQLFFDLETLGDLVREDNILCDLIHSNGSLINPVHLKNEIAKTNPRFRGMNQQDSFEFLIYLLEYVSITIPISEHISFSIGRKTKCPCGRINSEQNWVDSFLILPINDMCRHITDCISLYLQYNNLCSLCSEITTTHTIDSKRYLIVVLKRYSNSIQKNNAKIEVPEELAVCSQTFSLRGFIHHYGFITCGHYIYIRKIKNKWFIFNDENIEEITQNERLREYKDSGYVYLFELNQPKSD
jgi:uncharacterized UBP type Zn finger protein